MTPNPTTSLFSPSTPLLVKWAWPSLKSLRLHQTRLHRLAIKKVPHGVAKHGEQLARYLLETYRPQVLILDNSSYPGSRRSRALPKMTAAITQLAKRQGMTVVDYTPQEIKAVLAPGSKGVTKAVLCEALARRYPSLSPFLPKRLKQRDEPEPLYTNLFMAVALGLTWAKQHLGRK